MATLPTTAHTNGSTGDPASAQRSAHLTGDQPRRLDRALANAEYLLEYAAGAGIAVDSDVAQCILAAGRDRDGVWDGSNAYPVYVAMSKLSATVHPVTAETLRSGAKHANEDIAKFTRIAAILALVIVPFTMISFITAGLSASIAADIMTANQLVVTLQGELETATVATPRSAPDPVTVVPGNTLRDLQQFAMTIRSIKDHAGLLDLFLLNQAKSPVMTMAPPAFELGAIVPANARAVTAEFVQETYLYQEVRLYAKEVQDDVALFYGSIAACVLPMLYASLGACAYLLRVFSMDLKAQTFSRNYAISARFFIALIGGMIVGLFGNLSQGMSLSPLALAFLVGYGVDVFFSFLEGLLQNFKKMKTTS